MKFLAFALAGALTGCVHLPSPYAALPNEECTVFVDLIDALDDPTRARNGADPGAFPAAPRLVTPIAGPGGKADIATCGELLRRVHSHKAGSVMALHEPDPSGPSVMFTRVVFDKERQTATFDYAPSWGPLGLEVWKLTMRRAPDGHWKLTAWKLEMES